MKRFSVVVFLIFLCASSYAAPAQIATCGSQNSCTLTIPRYKMVMSNSDPNILWLVLAKCSNHFIKSINGGATWDATGGTDVRIKRTDTLCMDMHTSVSGDPSNNLYVTDPGTAAGANLYYRKVSNPATTEANMGPETYLTSLLMPSGVGIRSNILAQDSNNIWIFWRTSLNAAGNVRYFRSMDGGVTFPQEGWVSNTGYADVRIGSLLINGQPAVVIWYSDGSGLGWGFRYFVWDGTQFAANPDSSIFWGSKIYRREFTISYVNGDVHLVYPDNAGNLIHTRKAYSGGSGTWATSTIDSIGIDPPDWHPSLTAVGNDLYLIYVRNESSMVGINANIVWRKWNKAGNSWGALNYLTTSGTNRFPQGPAIVNPISAYIPVIWEATPSNVVMYDKIPLAPANNPPTVTLTSPANNSVVSGVITLTASATDDQGVAGVQFRVNGANAGLEITAPPYTMALNTTSWLNMQYAITAIARDTGGLTTTSLPVLITTSNIQPPPARIADLSVSSLTSNSVTLQWTATGNHGYNGAASSYDIRYSTSMITDANWIGAQQIFNEPVPAANGTAQYVTISGLQPSTQYFFGIKAIDDSFNPSALSNVPSATTSCAVAPLADSNAGSYNLSSVIDGIVNATGRENTTWASARTANDHWVDLYFCLPVTFNNATIWWAQQTNGIYASPQRVYVQYRNGTIWRDSSTISTGGNVPFTSVAFTPATSNIWRLFQPANMGTPTDNQVMWLTEIAYYNDANPTDPIPPSPIVNLAAANPTYDGATLTWTAQGDDGMVGTASQYDLRYSTSPITAANFYASTRITIPVPRASGTAESYVVTGLSPSTTYYFAIKSGDEVPNWSSLSNVVAFTTPAFSDLIPPNVYLNSPNSGLATFNTTLKFNCTATDNVQLTGIALYTNTTGNFVLDGFSLATGAVSTRVFTLDIPSAGNYIWNCYAYDNSSNAGYGVINYSFSILEKTYNLTLAPTIDAFSAKNDPGTVTNRSFTLSNIGNQDFNAVTCATSQGWATINNCPSALAAGSQQIVDVGFDTSNLAQGIRNVIVTFSTQSPAITLTANVTINVTSVPINPLPVIYNVSSSGISFSSASVVWLTDINSNSTVYYGTNMPAFDSNLGVNDNVQNHSIRLTGLIPNTTYYFMTGSCSLGGCSISGPPASFTTDPLPPGCAYNNPPCSTGTTCQSNFCVPVSNNPGGPSGPSNPGGISSPVGPAGPAPTKPNSSPSPSPTSPPSLEYSQKVIELEDSLAGQLDLSDENLKDVQSLVDQAKQLQKEGKYQQALALLDKARRRLSDSANNSKKEKANFGWQMVILLIVLIGGASSYYYISMTRKAKILAAPIKPGELGDELLGKISKAPDKPAETIKILDVKTINEASAPKLPEPSEPLDQKKFLDIK